MSQTRPILVTGGAGYIGSHTCKLLASSGFLPITYDNLSTGHAVAVRFGPLYQGDVRDVARLSEVITETQPIAVIHFAASAYVGESVENPGKYYDNNVGGMIALLDAVQKYQIKHLIFSSSCATYGMPDVPAISETTPQNPINPYGQTKLIGEHMLRDYAATGAFTYAALRYFNACGADCDGILTENHQPEPHIIPRLLMAAQGIIEQFQMFGDDYPTPDGSCIRDYIHVDDLAQGHVRALHHILNGGASNAYNLGLGHGYSVRELISACETLTGQPLPYSIAPRRAGDPPRLVAHASKAKRELGFAAKFSDLPTILRTALTSVKNVYGDNSVSQNI